MIEWKDYNGNLHSIADNIELEMQQPRCKYLLPCGLCTLFTDLKTCSLLMEVKKNEDSDE